MKSSFMGQKANPISLRLKTTNKNFTSCWYSDIFYPDIITQELRVKQYLSGLFTLMKYPNPCLSTSFLPKKTKTVVIYLNPFESRRRGCEKFQLRLIPGVRSVTPPMISTLTQNPPKVTALMTGTNQGHTTEMVCKRKTNENNLLSISQRYRRFFIEKLLVSMAVDKVIIKELIRRKNYQLFQRLHSIAWLQGREGHLFLLSNKQQGISMTSIPPTTNLRAGGGNRTVEHSCASLSPPKRWPKNNQRELKSYLRRFCAVSDTFMPFLSYQFADRKKNHLHIAYLESMLDESLSSPTALYLYNSVHETQSADFVSNEIAYYLERRVPFRRIKQLLLRELQISYIEGVRIICSGRVGGRSKKAQRARGERFQWGQTSSHVFSSKLSFASRSALTPFGKIGIKVWVCYK
jgi:hypothetical protein